jgi:hypothetical protein
MLDAGGEPRGCEFPQGSQLLIVNVVPFVFRKTVDEHGIMAQTPQDLQPALAYILGMSRAFKIHPDHPALAYLILLHADLGGKFLENRKQADRLADDMRHVEAVIRLFDPDYDIRRIAVKRRYQRNGLFKHGTLFRAAMDALRKAPELMTTRELVMALLAAKGVPEPSKKQWRGLSVAVQGILRKYNGRAVVRVGEGMPARWRLI